MKHALIPLLLLTWIVSYAIADSDTPQTLTAQKALERARAEIIRRDHGATWSQLGAYETVDLDPKTWGERYWAFRFPAEGHSVYYVNKQTGFVQASYEPKGDTKANWTRTYKKKDAGDRYLFTIIFDPLFYRSPDSYALDFRISEGDDSPHPKYYWKESKTLALIKDVQNLHSITVSIFKEDLKKYKYVDPIIIGPPGGVAQPVKIDQVADE